ncbi:hypothetical protein [Paenibacillus polymyxa]|nr:hypothetical protein [Paenibacillus polymyxa]
MILPLVSGIMVLLCGIREANARPVVFELNAAASLNDRRCP